MAKFLKHIGRHGDRKVAVVFREVPGEEHMCLVIYPDLLNTNMHDPIMNVIESAPGQASDNLGEALSRNYTKDGKIILNVLHVEGMMKKVQTNQIYMTPAPNQSVRLSELNQILSEMKQGEAAVKKMAELDASRGLQDPKDVKRRREEARAPAQQAPTPSANGIMGDNDLARQRLQQSARMAAEARGLLAESARLEQEAFAMDPALAPAAPAPAKKARVAKVKAEVMPVVEAAPVKRTRGRKAAQ
jgi:hypothetical protein